MAVMGAAVATAMNMTPHSPTALGLRRWTRGFPRSVAGLVTLSSADIWILSSARGAPREVPIECGVDHTMRSGEHTSVRQYLMSHQLSLLRLKKKNSLPL